MSEQALPLRIVVGSANAAKIRAVELAASRIFAPRKCEVRGVEVSSGVAAQPMSAEETIQGAQNRARAALKLGAETGCDFAVGLEGGLECVGARWFECGWFCVLDGAGKLGLGSSARFLVGECALEHSPLQLCGSGTV